MESGVLRNRAARPSRDRPVALGGMVWRSQAVSGALPRPSFV